MILFDQVVQVFRGPQLRAPGSKPSSRISCPAESEVNGLPDPAQDRCMRKMQPAFGHHLDQITEAGLVA